MIFTLKNLHVCAATLMLALSGSLALADGSGEHSHHQAMNAGAMGEASDFGKPGVATGVKRTIEISMGDNMRFTPDNIQIRQGETIRFTLKNTGATQHEMVLGTADDVREHAEMMKKMPNMQHTDANIVRVEPGKSGDIIWNFDLEGEFQFACLMPGHREAGMTGSITVTPSM